ncbi:cob(I)yrinic acid a,c-diamide adenosyltransferase [Desulfurispira natronophila]|uniref:corrinoid adenosyltransferase n=1 Tax=Desulfurispira natronophila TaxID=682562 RepID=A0A7W7Y5H1_9BACT|nr:cob(I)yrinic acid a,c-diamide adenosyltransferase [Desulfurispira natronophila]MBB5022357.1 cob(I)alamin adenosyltransferase [Desulfurispira natronophila]
MLFQKGYMQIYTGNGKGKTTASLGLALRCVGAGGRVFISQFLKDGDYSESAGLGYFGDCVTHETSGCGHFVRGKPSEEDKAKAVEGLERARLAMLSGEYNMVILDEANVAAAIGLIPLESLQQLVAQRPESVELVLTGRDAHPELMDMADLVTRMEEVKHYYRAGVAARVGIEK